MASPSISVEILSGSIHCFKGAQINIEKFIMSLKVTWIKKILDSYNNGVLKKK